VNIATKLPVWLVKEPQDCARLFNEQLERLGVEMVDFYLLHALNRNSWQQALENEALEVFGADAGGRTHPPCGLFLPR